VLEGAEEEAGSATGERGRRRRVREKPGREREVTKEPATALWQQSEGSQNECEATAGEGSVEGGGNRRQGMEGRKREREKESKKDEPLDRNPLRLEPLRRFLRDDP
jgi:hypothetical protein